MRNFTFKGLFLAVVFIVLGSLSIQAADGLITKQITIKLEKAGTLPDKIGSTKKYQITNLKILGEINGTDLMFIRNMAGGIDYYDETGEGKLSVLDLSQARIVVGGGPYFYYFKGNPTDGYSRKLYVDENDVLGDYMFCGCSALTSLTLPSSVTKIGNYAFEYCSGLTSMKIPFSVTSIGGSAFKGCSGLTSIYVYAEQIYTIGLVAFKGCDKNNCKVYVPKGTYDYYIKYSDFRYFKNIEEFDATGINNVITPFHAKEVSRYSINGQRLSAPTKGLNIVKYSDGSVKKVAVQ